ncbi:MAG: aldo/keto reductase [Ruminococcaceae bacterium]|nr:aldo/keto reductase [Oscillospiraceae bacterium]
MQTISLGSTGIVAQINGFGALPIQRDDKDTAVRLLRKAYEHGINYYDTARGYTDSEEKIGLAFGDMGIRDRIYIATKTHAGDVAGFWRDLETSLRMLRTDYIDVYQFHNPKQVYRPGDGTGMYEAMLEAKAKGMVRHIGFTNHSLERAAECITSGLYETLQFPFSYLSGAPEMELVRRCREANMGFIAMKGLAGGLITNSAAAYAAIAEAGTVLAIWGVQRESELDEFLSYIDAPPVMTDALRAVIEADRKELSGDFCRGCGYCMPCTVGIDISTAARMSQLIRRAPSAPWLSEAQQANMRKIEECVECGACASRCPYGLDTPRLLKKCYEDYKKILSGEVSVT